MAGVSQCSSVTPWSVVRLRVDFFDVFQRRRFLIALPFLSRLIGVVETQEIQTKLWCRAAPRRAAPYPQISPAGH